MWQPAKKVFLRDIMPHDATSTRTWDHVIQGKITRQYTVIIGGRRATLDDEVDRNCYSTSHWFVNAWRDIWPLRANDRVRALAAILQGIRDRILPVIHPNRTNGGYTVRHDGSLCATTIGYRYGGMGIEIINVLGDLERLRYKANKFVSFGVTLADSLSAPGSNFLPDAGGLNVLRHLIFDMCKVSCGGGSYRTIYWNVLRHRFQ